MFSCSWPGARLPARSGASFWGITSHLTRFTFIHPLSEKSNQADPIWRQLVQTLADVKFPPPSMERRSGLCCTVRCSKHEPWWEASSRDYDVDHYVIVRNLSKMWNLIVTTEVLLNAWNFRSSPTLKMVSAWRLRRYSPPKCRLIVKGLHQRVILQDSGSHKIPQRSCKCTSRLVAFHWDRTVDEHWSRILKASFGYSRNRPWKPIGL
jgi:hypothetical protein